MIHLHDDTRQLLIESVRRYFAEHLDEEVGELKAAMLLTFCLEEIGPAVYNQAIADAKAHLLTQVDDLDGTCHEPEFGYWKKDR